MIELTQQEQDILSKKIFDKHPVNKEIYNQEKYTKPAYQAGVIDGYLELLPAIAMLEQRLKDMKTLDEAGVIDKTIFQGFDYSIKQTEDYLNSIKIEV